MELSSTSLLELENEDESEEKPVNDIPGNEQILHVLAIVLAMFLQ